MSNDQANLEVPRGGKRINAGRKPGPTGKRENLSTRVEPETMRKIRAEAERLGISIGEVLDLWAKGRTAGGRRQEQKGPSKAAECHALCDGSADETGARLRRQKPGNFAVPENSPSLKPCSRC
jgi:hypothetical protein